MPLIIRDLRYAWRLLWASPGFSFVAVLTLALGIGTTTAVFSVTDAVLLEPLPFPGADRLIRVWESNPAKGQERSGVLPGSVRDWMEQSKSFETLTAYGASRALLTVGDGSEYIKAAWTTPEFFSVLGVKPMLGRPSLSDKREQVISYSLWRRKYGADPNVVGKNISFLRFANYTIVGVMPPGFDFPGGVEAWSAEDLPRASRGERSTSQALARLKPGTSLDQALTELKAIARQSERDHPETNAGWTVVAEPLMEATVGNVRSALLVLAGAVGCVLLIGCANVANLLLARAAVRSHEMAVRGALGATRGQLVAQSLAETLTVALAGGSAGILLAYVMVHALLAYAPGDIPRLEGVAIDWRMGVFALLLSVTIAVLLTAAYTAGDSRAPLSDQFRQHVRESSLSRRRRTRELLIAVEIALSLVLLIGAGLLLRTFISLERVDLGVRPSNVITAEVALPIGKFPRGPRVPWSRLAWNRFALFYRELIQYTDALPGVESAAGVNVPPVAEKATRYFTRGKDANVPVTERWTVDRVVVTPEYFQTLGIPIKRGRAFTAHDDNIDDVLSGASRPRPGVAIVNDVMARSFWPGQEALGQPIAMEADSAVTFRTIVGIVGDVRRSPVSGEAPPTLYIPYDQFPDYAMTLVVRAHPAGARQVASSLPGALRSFDRDLAVSKVVPFDALVGNSISRQRFTLLLLLGFAGCGLVLALVGVFGVVSYVMSQRTREIAIRVALGASHDGLLRLLIGDSLKPLAAGMGAGLVLALVGSRLLAAQLYRVSPTDALTYGIVCLLLAAVGLIATWIPSRRALTVDPIRILKSE